MSGYASAAAAVMAAAVAITTKQELGEPLKKKTDRLPCRSEFHSLNIRCLADYAGGDAQASKVSRRSSPGALSFDATLLSSVTKRPTIVASYEKSGLKSKTAAIRQIAACECTGENETRLEHENWVSWSAEANRDACAAEKGNLGSSRVVLAGRRRKLSCRLSEGTQEERWSREVQPQQTTSTTKQEKHATRRRIESLETCSPLSSQVVVSAATKSCRNESPGFAAPEPPITFYCGGEDSSSDSSQVFSGKSSDGASRKGSSRTAFGTSDLPPAKRYRPIIPVEAWYSRGDSAESYRNGAEKVLLDETSLCNTWSAPQSVGLLGKGWGFRRGPRCSAGHGASHEEARSMASKRLNLKAAAEKGAATAAVTSDVDEDEDVTSPAASVSTRASTAGFCIQQSNNNNNNNNSNSNSNNNHNACDQTALRRLSSRHSLLGEDDNASSCERQWKVARSLALAPPAVRRPPAVLRLQSLPLDRMRTHAFSAAGLTAGPRRHSGSNRDVILEDEVASCGFRTERSSQSSVPFRVPAGVAGRMAADGTLLVDSTCQPKHRNKKSVLGITYVRHKTYRSICIWSAVSATCLFGHLLLQCFATCPAPGVWHPSFLLFAICLTLLSFGSLKFASLGFCGVYNAAVAARLMASLVFVTTDIINIYSMTTVGSASVAKVVEQWLAGAAESLLHIVCLLTTAQTLTNVRQDRIELQVLVPVERVVKTLNAAPFMEWYFGLPHSIDDVSGGEGSEAPQANRQRRSV